MGDTTFDVKQAGPGVAVIAVSGDVTPAVEDDLVEAYGKATASEPSAVVLDFTGLEYMNSGGIGLLVTLLVRAQRSKQELRAFGLTDHYRQILQLTRLDEAIAIHESEADALAVG